MQSDVSDNSRLRYRAGGGVSAVKQTDDEDVSRAAPGRPQTLSDVCKAHGKTDTPVWL